MSCTIYLTTVNIVSVLEFCLVQCYSIVILICAYTFGKSTQMSTTIKKKKWSAKSSRNSKRLSDLKEKQQTDDNRIVRALVIFGCVFDMMKIVRIVIMIIIIVTDESESAKCILNEWYVFNVSRCSPCNKFMSLCS